MNSPLTLQCVDLPLTLKSSDPPFAHGTVDPRLDLMYLDPHLSLRVSDPSLVLLHTFAVLEPPSGWTQTAVVVWVRVRDAGASVETRVVRVTEVPHCNTQQQRRCVQSLWERDTGACVFLLSSVQVRACVCVCV